MSPQEEKDRAKRAWDAIQIHYMVGDDPAGWWVAISLFDGRSDGQIYKSKQEATRYQLHEYACAYICLPPHSQLSVKEIEEYLHVNDLIYAAGHRLSDAGTHIVPSHLVRPV